MLDWSASLECMEKKSLGSYGCTCVSNAAHMKLISGMVVTISHVNVTLWSVNQNFPDARFRKQAFRKYMHAICCCAFDQIYAFFWVSKKLTQFTEIEYNRFKKVSRVPCSQKSHLHLHMVMAFAFFSKHTPTAYGLPCISRKLYKCLLHHS